jgi:hypothetical protein
VLRQSPSDEALDARIREARANAAVGTEADTARVDSALFLRGARRKIRAEETA